MDSEYIVTPHGSQPAAHQVVSCEPQPCLQIIYMLELHNNLRGLIYHLLWSLCVPLMNQSTIMIVSHRCPPPSIPHTKWCLFSEASQESCTQQTHIMFASASNNFFFFPLYNNALIKINHLLN